MNVTAPNGGGLVPCAGGAAGDQVRYSPAVNPAIAEDDRVSAAIMPAGAGLPGRVGMGELTRGGLLVRQAEPGDRAALEGMFQRCSPQTVYRRFHGHLRAFPPRFLAAAVAGVPEHFALVACRGPRVVAMASCVFSDPGDSARTAELGVLVEDEFQRQGLGRLLVAGLVAHAREAGLATLQAQMLMEQDWLLGLLAEFGRCESTFQRGVREATLHLL